MLIHRTTILFKNISVSHESWNSGKRENVALNLFSLRNNIYIYYMLYALSLPDQS